MNRLMDLKLKSNRVIKILGGILKKRYPDFEKTNTVPLIDLLEWDHWPGFIQIYGEVHTLLPINTICVQCLFIAYFPYLHGI